MKLKQNRHIRIDFEGDWARRALLLIAASSFLQLVYYFGLVNLAEMGFLQIVFVAVLPLLLSVGYFVFLYILRWNAPGICGLVGAGFCALLAVSSFFTGDILRIVLACGCYAIAAGVLLLQTAGSLHNTSLCVAVFVIPAILRIVFFGIGRIGLAEIFREAAVICLLSSLACIPKMLEHTKRR